MPFVLCTRIHEINDVSRRTVSASKGAMLNIHTESDQHISECTVMTSERVSRK